MKGQGGKNLQRAFKEGCAQKWGLSRDLKGGKEGDRRPQEERVFPAGPTRVRVPDAM